MKVAQKIVCTTLLTSVLLGFAGVTAAAADSSSGSPAIAMTAQDPAVAAGDDMNVESTKRFSIQNFSGNTLRLSGIPAKERTDNSELPKVGTVVLPGADLPLEVTYYFLADNNVNITWDVLDDQGRVVGTAVTRLSLDGFNTKVTKIVSQSGPAEFASASGDVTVTDRQAAVHVVPAGQGQRQADILNRLCGENASIDCDFDIKTSTKGYGPVHVIDGVEINNTDSVATTIISKKEIVSATNTVSVGASIKASILNIVEVAVNSSYETAWSNSQEFTWTRELSISPFHKGWLEVSAPVINHTGDFIVKVGKTEWILQDVTFTSPNKDGHARYARQQVPLTDKEKEVTPPTVFLSTESVFDAIVQAADAGLTISTDQLH